MLANPGTMDTTLAHRAACPYLTSSCDHGVSRARYATRNRPMAVRGGGSNMHSPVRPPPPRPGRRTAAGRSSGSRRWAGCRHRGAAPPRTARQLEVPIPPASAPALPRLGQARALSRRRSRDVGGAVRGAVRNDVDVATAGAAWTAACNDSLRTASSLWAGISTATSSMPNLCLLHGEGPGGGRSRRSAAAARFDARRPTHVFVEQRQRHRRIERHVHQRGRR